MSEHDFPACVCQNATTPTPGMYAATPWESLVQQLGFAGTPQSREVSCARCGRWFLQIGYQDQRVLLVLPTGWKQLTAEFIAEINAWIDRCLCPAWLTRREDREKHRAAAWTAALPALQERIGEPAYPGTLTFYQLSKDQQAIVLETEKATNELPLRLSGGVYPPGTLAQMVPMFYRSADKWFPVDPAHAAGLSVPRHPELVRNDALFDKVLSGLQAALALPTPISREEVPAGYSGAPPWCRFVVGKTTFIVGQCKRVVEVTATFSEPVLYAEIEALVVGRDRATFDADQESPDHPGYAGRILAHAWTVPALLEYLTILGRLALSETTP